MAAEPGAGLRIFRDILRRADKNDDGKLSFDEFKAYFADGVLSGEELHELFHTIDTHNTDNLDTEELCEYFSQHLGEYGNVLSVLEDLNITVLKAMDKTKKDYQEASDLEQFVTRFLLKETLNQLQSLQSSLECAMETTEEQTRQERQGPTKPEVLSIQWPGKRSARRLQRNNSLSPNSPLFSTGWIEEDSQWMTQINRLQKLIDRLEKKVSHSPGQHTIQSTWVTPSVQESFQDHHGGPQEGSGWPRSTDTEAAAEAECPAPAPQGPTAYDAALWDTAQRIVSEAVRRAVAEILGTGQEPEEQQDLAQRMDVENETSKEGCQGRDNSILHGIWINPSVQELLQDAPAGPQEGSGLPSCTDTEAAAEAGSPAPAQHSPAEDGAALSDMVEDIVSEAVRRAEAEIQGPGQQPEEQQDLAQCMDVPVAAPAPAALEAIEAHLAGEDEGQPSTAPLVPAAKDQEENTVSSMSGEHGGETNTDIACPAQGPAPQRRPSRFRRALRALRRAFRCSCTAGQREE